MYVVFENDGFYEMFDNHDEAKECAAKLRECHRQKGRRPHANFRKMTKAEVAEVCQMKV